MGHQIIKQPNGKYAVFSSIVDNFIILDATKQDIIEYYVKEQTHEITMRTNNIIERLEKGEKPYYQFTKTWTMALDWIKQVHGEDAIKVLERELSHTDTDKVNHVACKD